MTKKYSAIAIGGPSDGHRIEADSHIIAIPDTDSGGMFTYGWHSAAGVYYWTSTNQGMPLSRILAMLLERYGQFRDFASGKTLEVINLQNDRIHELLAADAGAKAREQNLRDELDAMRSNLEAAADEIRDVRHWCAVAGFADHGLSAAGLVHNMASGLERLRETHMKVVASVIAELKSTGHKHEGHTLDTLVDIAIDTERTRHEDNLKRIGDACGISFAIGNNYMQMADVIVNSLRMRFEKKLVAMQAKPDEANGERVPTLEERVKDVEDRLNRHFWPRLRR